MLVTSKCIGNRVTGLYVGVDNVRRHFPKRVAAIELQLDHLRIECGLSPQFWDSQPEIQDPRLCLWLESKHSQRKESRSPLSLAMTRSGEHSFTLGPVNHKNEPKIRLADTTHRIIQPRSTQIETALAV
jgi:hypothetical protein